ncbi:PPOX class F420-dependent oxidoreductase [Gordonia soli]|uniref:Pyridoxamine 5'-phosphate oxidase N-terminal domain-containing protein n=1 Tax=Gordonia soli NBRC 108243 TaxID=1223545 RepID=M0QFP0_9ACTN|nr:PPOX class F420-dependent oxidoreductase [Gordonia soli]GAC67279.1 hypothetical protein GS4_07_00280 [Gordonia soli NBRC 108243]
MSDAPFGEATEAKYVLLTTFKKDGTAVGTPIWAARDGDQLTVWTSGDSWKVKRIRRNPHVIVQACDNRGNKTYGAQAHGTARLLDRAGSDHVRSLITKKYGIVGWLIVKSSVTFRGADKSIGISIAPGQPSSE